MATLKEMLTKTSSDLKSSLHQELNVCGIGGETFQANAILENVKKVHERMEEIMMSGRLFGSVSTQGSSSGILAGMSPPSVLTEPSVPVIV